MSEPARTLRVYVCHPFSGDVVTNREKVRSICENLKLEGKGNILPVAPHLYLPEFVDEFSERDIALRFCLSLLECCQLVYVYGNPTAGMQIEIEHAEEKGITVVRFA